MLTNNSNLFSATLTLLFVISSLFLFGCEATTTQNPENSEISIGKSRIEDDTNIKNPDNEAGIDPMPVISEDKKPEEQAKTERISKEEQLRLQAEVEKVYQEISKQADEWAKDKRIQIDKLLLQANKMLEEGNLTEAERLFNEVLKKFPDHKIASEKLLEISALQRKAFEIEKTTEEKVKELLSHAKDLKKRRTYKASLALLLEAKRLIESSETNPILKNLKPEIFKEISEIEKLIPSSKNKKQP